MNLLRAPRFLKKLPFACLNCKRPLAEHAGENCFFDTTKFAPIGWPHILISPRLSEGRSIALDIALQDDQEAVEQAIYRAVCREHCRNCGKMGAMHDGKKRRCRVGNYIEIDGKLRTDVDRFWFPASIKMREARFFKSFKSLGLWDQHGFLVDAYTLGRNGN